MNLHRSVCLAAAFVSAVAGVQVQAQTLGERDSFFDVTFTNLSFANASALYTLNYFVPAQAPFSTGFTTLLIPNNQNFTFYSGGGVTYSPVSEPPGSTTIPGTLSSNGNAGSFGVSYNTAATTGGDLLTLGSAGGHATLTFLGGGSVTGFSNYPYVIDVTLPGKWTTMGTATGDYNNVSIGSGFSFPTFSYNSGTNTTSILSFDPNYQSGGATDLKFTLVGAVPEPSTYFMLLAGLASIGFAMRRRQAGRPAAIPRFG